MTQEEFEKRIENMQWDEDDEPSEWWRESSAKGFVRIGNKLVAKGFTYDEALSLLGSCYGITAGEFGN